MPHTIIPRRQSQFLRIALLLLIGCLAQPTYAQATPRPIGFALKVFTESFFSSTIAKIEVAQVFPNSQAQAAGISVGDELIRVQGLVVPGGDGSKLKPHMEFVPGEPKQLAFKRPDGSEYQVTLTRATP